ncbi:T9SS C-terminal target domain-containing protein [Sphingobacteriales bacterium UPWRP_1]|nr:hypothetical protein BVG80_05025 [Sphingobacteriales bacterium TSM_CSM]PSJ73757.1 T9SS C-terminal target domain-containing protein [Sphingobacteriales bacterium UPWRP_1]
MARPLRLPKRTILLHTITQLTIYNTIGCKALSQYFKGAGTWHIQINTLPPGLYYYTLTSNGELFKSDKLVIVP